MILLCSFFVGSAFRRACDKILIWNQNMKKLRLMEEYIWRKFEKLGGRTFIKYIMCFESMVISHSDCEKTLID